MKSQLSIEEYQKKIADMVLDSYWKMIDKENQIIRGGGAYKPSQNPLPIVSMKEPSFETPTPIAIRKKGGSILNSLKKSAMSAAKGTAKIATPIVQKAGEKVLNKLADKAVNSLVDRMSASGIKHAVEEGSTMKHIKRLPRRMKKMEIEEMVEINKPRRGRKKKEHGGNFISAIKRIGNKVINKVGDKLVNKGIDEVGKLITNPEVDEGVAEAAAGIRKRRAPTRRNMLIREIMRKHHMSLPEASKYIKEHNLK